MFYEKWFEIKSTDHFPVYLVKSLVNRFGDHEVAQIGGQLSYFFLLSLFPFIIFFNTLVSTFQLITDVVVEFLSPVLPAEIIEVVNSYIAHVSTGQNYGLLSIGIIITLFSASKAVRSLDIAINTAYDVLEKRNYFIRLLLSVVLTLVAGVAIVILVIVTNLSGEFVVKILELLHVSKPVANILYLLRWGVILFMMFLGLSGLYYIMPNCKKTYKSVVPGTVFTICGFVLFTAVFSLYAQSILASNTFYGSIGTIMILMLWLYIVGIITVLGAELNSSIRSYNLLHKHHT